MYMKSLFRLYWIITVIIKRQDWFWNVILFYYLNKDIIELSTRCYSVFVVNQLSLFWKHESRLTQSPCCVSVNPLPLTFEYLNQSLWNFVCISWHLSPSQWHTYKSLPSVCVYVCVSLLPLLGKGSIKCISPFIARYWLSKHVPAATNTCNNRRIVGQ
jgi:hypothetical protein